MNLNVNQLSELITTLSAVVSVRPEIKEQDFASIVSVVRVEYYDDDNQELKYHLGIKIELENKFCKITRGNTFEELKEKNIKSFDDILQHYEKVMEDLFTSDEFKQSIEEAQNFEANPMEELLRRLMPETKILDALDEEDDKPDLKLVD